MLFVCQLDHDGPGCHGRGFYMEIVLKFPDDGCINIVELLPYGNRSRILSRCATIMTCMELDCCDVRIICGFVNCGKYIVRRGPAGTLAFWGRDCGCICCMFGICGACRGFWRSCVIWRNVRGIVAVLSRTSTIS